MRYLMKGITRIIQSEMRSWCRPLGSASQKLSRLHKNSPDIIRATQGIQPSKHRRLHPLGFYKINEENIWNYRQYLAPLMGKNNVAAATENILLKLELKPISTY